MTTMRTHSSLIDLDEDAPTSAQVDFLPGPVLLLGAPGVGKGTQAQLLMDAFGIPQISTGDLLRHHVREGTDLGRSAKLLMDQGQLVPDDLVNGMVADRLAAADVAQGYILDGFPRTEAQASWLDGALPGLQHSLPLIAVRIQVPHEALRRRITGRRSCPLCRRIYNLYTHPPQTSGICDVDQTPLTHRSDDTVEAFTERMAEYETKTAPVIEHYRLQGRFREIDGAGSLPEVEGRIITSLRDLRSAGSADVSKEARSWPS